MINQKIDVAILGGGLVGGIIALDLAKRNFHVLVVDHVSPEALLNPTSDGRTTAVNLASQKYFQDLGLWPDLLGHAQPIEKITVYEQGSAQSIHFDHTELGNDPMGYIVDNHYLRQAILSHSTQHPNIQWMAPASLVSKKLTSTGMHLFIQNEDKILELDVPLLICAEGRNSKTREDMGIKAYEFPYHQQALVFSVTHEKHHQNRAWEVFQPEGPLAFLPATDLEGTPRSGVVWSLSSEYGEFWKTQENSVIEAKLFELFPHLGPLRLCTKIWNFPLSAQMTKSVLSDRFVLIGDAAHTCHPVAGQGVNVGWRDAKLLAEILEQTRSLGLDLGGQPLLKDYQRRRRLDTYSIFAMTDGMVRLFGNKSTILGFMRSSGLGFVNRFGPLRRFFMKRAMGQI